jgi:hypothetical protein
MCESERSVRVPEPHPLDYDWRYSSRTVWALSERAFGRTIAVGCPSIARVLRCRGIAHTSVDWQPHNAEHPNSTVIDVGNAGPMQGNYFDTAFQDPPWYPADLVRWMIWTAQHLVVGGRLFSSIWPEETRPTGQAERAHVLALMSAWSDVRIVPSALCYEVPYFEQVARQLSGESEPAQAWRTGDLIEAVITRRPPPVSPQHRPAVWYRFVWNTYQLAVRADAISDGPQYIGTHPQARGWIWPEFSKRARGRDEIGMWSSRNEVAIVRGSADIISQLLAFTDAKGLTDLRGPIKSVLESWQVPQPPFFRSQHWNHTA